MLLVHATHITKKTDESTTHAAFLSAVNMLVPRCSQALSQQPYSQFPGIWVWETGILLTLARLVCQVHDAVAINYAWRSRDPLAIQADAGAFA